MSQRPPSEYTVDTACSHVCLNDHLVNTQWIQPVLCMSQRTPSEYTVDTACSCVCLNDHLVNTQWI